MVGLGFAHRLITGVHIILGAGVTLHKAWHVNGPCCCCEVDLHQTLDPASCCIGKSFAASFHLASSFDVHLTV
jgi:hypothetical protein